MKKIFKIMCLFMFVLTLSGCKKYYVDLDNKKNLNEIEITILEKLNEKYDKGFEVEYITEEDYYVCDFMIEDCLIHNDVKDAKKYIFEGIDEDGIYFDVYYVDPYYDDDSNSNEEQIIDNYSSELESLSNKYIINYYDNKEAGTLYKLKMDERGSYELYVINYSQEIDEDTSSTYYSGILKENIFFNVEKILEYIKEKNNLKNDIYEFYYDSEKVKSFSDNETLLSLIIDIEYISDKKGKIEGVSKKEIGTKNITEIYEEIFGENVDENNKDQSID